MDKQEAINFILQELGKHRSKDEITADLSNEIGAPSEMVSKFVAQVASGYQASPQQNISDASPADLRSNQNMATASAATKAPTDAVQAFLQGNTPSDRNSTASPGEDPELEEMILGALSKSKRHSDIAMMVCEQTGMNWNQAQRTVARVEMKNRGKLAAKQNRIVIPLIIAALVFGALLVVSGIYEYYTSIQGFTYGNQIPDEFVVREGTWAFFTGIILFLGGMAGLIVALQKQFSE